MRHGEGQRDCSGILLSDVHEQELIDGKKIGYWSAGKNNVADHEERPRVGVDPHGLLHGGGCGHLPAEVAAVDEEVVGGHCQLDPLAPLPPQPAPHRHRRALVQQSQPQFDGVQLPQLADPGPEDAEEDEEEGDVAHQVDPGEEHGKGRGEGDEDMGVVEHC